MTTAVLQLGNAIAGEIVPAYLVGNTVPCVLTLFADVTQAETPADATSTLVTCSCTLAAGAYGPGSLVAAVPGASGPSYSNVAPVTSSGGVVTGIAFQASYPGPTPAVAPSTLTMLLSSTPGFTACTNPAAQSQIGAYSVVCTVTAPDGSTSTPTVTSPNPQTGAYAALVPVTKDGIYDVAFAWTVAGNPGAASGAMTVEGEGATVNPSNTWVFVAQAQSPYPATGAFPFVAIDLRQGIVLVQFPQDPEDGQELTLSDWFDLSSQGSPGTGQPGGPIRYATLDGTEVEDVSNPGTFGTSGHIASPGKWAGTFKFAVSENAWGLKTPA